MTNSFHIEYKHRLYVGFLLVLGAGLLSGCANQNSIILDVPFAAQSPYANWDALHEEACEEMSLIMVHHFLDGTPLTQSGAEMEVQQMVAWETANDYGVDVSARELGVIATAHYEHHARLLTNVTAETLRTELSLGHPIIIPVAGRELHNPHFERGDPFYHMLVVIGYSGDNFITNEPGTKNGAKYVYSSEVLMSALHDWTGVKEEIATGAKTALVVE